MNRRRPASRRAFRGRQRGFALLMLAAMIVAGSAWLLVSSLTNSANRTAQDRAHNGAVLAEAKQALIAYVAQQAALATEDNPGRLPCPEAAGYFGDTAQEGIAAGTCSLPKVGRLPWRTLGIERPLDASGEVLWYAVSAGWANDGGTLSINSNTLAQLSVGGVPNAAVAVIIAPGAPLSVPASANCTARGQARKTADGAGTPIAPDFRDYLECENATYPADATFVTTGPSTSFNDHLVAISVAELMPAVEAAVATRIKRDVMPQLASVYASPTWGSDSATPIYPFAAPFQDPNTSDFKGVSGYTQGLLPINASTCDAMTAGRCDSTFVSWNSATATAAKTSGTATTFVSNCTASTSAQLQCTVTYSRSSCFLCSYNATVQMRGYADNVGMTLRTFNSALASGLTTLTAPIQTDGRAWANYTGVLTKLCGTLIGTACTATATLTIPITVFQDHAFLNPSAGDAWYWFFANNWHHLTYYSIAASHAPSGTTHNCSTIGDCITITGNTPSTNIRATLVLAGRSLTTATRPNGTLTDFLDTAENQNGDRAFEQKKVGKTFNDRFVSLSSY